jgi:hypothetical protein
VPNDFRKALDSTKRRSQENALHTVDFIHLADFLFKPYSTIGDETLIHLIRECNSIAEVEGIKSQLPQSNWTRYFSRLVHCQDGELRKKWTELYDLRCKVAHNALITRGEFDAIASLCDELEAILVGAIQKLPQVDISRKDAAQVAANAAGRLFSSEGEVLYQWSQVERVLRLLARLVMDRPSMSWSKNAKALADVGIVSNELVQELSNLSRVRNGIAHGALTIEDESVQKMSAELVRVLADLIEIAEREVGEASASAQSQVSDVTDEIPF